ncbi:MAG: hypothetical protein AABY27_02645 [Pseudomonadota bacterium]
MLRAFNYIKLSYKQQLFAIFVSIIFIFYLLLHFVTENILSDIRGRAERKLIVIENFLLSSLDSKQQILYGLAFLLADEEMKPFNNSIDNLVKSFDNRASHSKSISFKGIKVMDSNNLVILHTLVPNKIFVPMKNISDLELIELAKKELFETKIGPIRLGKLNNELIIPSCIAIGKDNKVHIGTVCAGISMAELSEKLDYYIKDRNINKIEILPLNSKEDNGNRIHNGFTFLNILMSAIKDEALVFINRFLTTLR